MLARCAPVDAIEMDSFARDCARAREVEGVRGVRAGSLPDDLPVQGPYSAVFSLDVVEHVEDDLAALRAMGKLLHKDGLLFVTVPAYQWMWSYHDEINHHVRRYDRSQIIRVVEEAELQVVYSSYFNTILAPLAILARGVEKALGRFRPPRSSVGLTMPPAWVNRIMEAIFGIEQWVAGRWSLPFGLSIVVVARSDSLPGRQ